MPNCEVYEAGIVREELFLGEMQIYCEPGKRCPYKNRIELELEGTHVICKSHGG